MKIETKFNIGDKVYCKDNLKYDEIIGVRQIIENCAYDSGRIIAYDAPTEYLFRNSREWHREASIFATKDELIEYINNNL